MSDSNVRVEPDSTGKKIQTFENTVSSQSVHAQAVVLVDDTGTPYVPATSASVQIASAAATSADAHANTVSARVVSVSAELVSLLASVESRLSTRIDLGGGTASVTSNEVSAVSAQAASAKNVVSARVVSVSAELVSLIQGYATTATDAGTTTLTASSPPEQFFTGSTTQTVKLPDVTTLTLGRQYLVKNDSTGVVTVQSSGANTIVAMAGGSTAVFTCIAITGTGTSSWSYAYSNTASDTVSARVASVSAELASLVQIASVAATSADAHANTVSERVVSVSAELVSLMASADTALSARITSVGGAGGASVTSAEVQIASAAATSADAHANTVSARAVSISAELVSLMVSADAALSARITSVGGAVGGSVTSAEVQVASAAATSADAHANTVSARAVSISAELTSLLASVESRLSVRIDGAGGGGSVTSNELSATSAQAASAKNVVSARAVSISAELVSLIQGYATTATAAGTTTLTAADPPEQFFTGSTTQTVKLPDVTTLTLGRQYLVKNDSTGVVTVQSSGANTIVAMTGGSTAVFTCIAITGTGTSSWSYAYSNTASDTVSARVASVSAELASLVQIASVAATSADNHANTVSARAVSISNELGSLLVSASAALETHIVAASAAATSADAHANTVSARVVSVSAELVSIIASAASRKAVNTADQASITISTGLTVSGVSITLTAGQTYIFEFQIPFNCKLPSGIVVGVVGPTTNRYFARYEIPGAVGTAGVAPSANAVTPFNAQVRAINTKVSTTSITLTATTLMAYAWGTINPSADGSIKFIIGPNTSGGANSGVIPLLGCNVTVTRVA